LERDVFDRITISLVRAADGTIEGSLPLRAPYLVTSRDGRTLAAATVDARQPGRLRVGRTADVVEGSSLPEGGPALPPGAYPTGGMALDPEGHRLAVVTRGDRPQEPARIFVFERVGDAWRETGSMAAPAGATGGTVTWLP
jgi:hypothetical protein